MNINYIKNIKKYIEDFLYAILGGICIGIGGTIFLSIENTIIGSIFFSIGLIIILYFNLNLFTGKTGYVLKNDIKYLFNLIIIWFGNLIGTNLVARLCSFTRIKDKIQPICDTLVNVKLNDTYLSMFILSIFCGFLMYVAVDAFKQKNNFLYVILPTLCVSVFILCGFEHSIADMFYFSLSNQLLSNLDLIILISLGNFLGSNIIPITKKSLDLS